MSRPSFENIDRWLFEYAEGNLTAQQVADLKSFLWLHPELEIDLDAWEAAKVNADGITLPEREKYKKRAPIIPFAYQVGAAAAVTVGAIVTIFSLGNQSGFRPDMERGTFSGRKMYAEKTAVYTQRSERLSAFYQHNARNMDLFRPVPHQPHGERRSTNGETPALASMNGTDRVDQLPAASYDPGRISTNYRLSPAESPSFNSHHSTHVSGSKSRHSTFLKPFFRKVIRMMDNPIALKNSKDAVYQVPGMQNPQINFGTVGTLLTSRFQAISRVQYAGDSNELFTNTVSFDTYNEAIHGGIGIQLKTDTYAAGAFQNYEAAITYSPKFSISKNIILEPGIRFKMGQKRLDASKVSPGSEVELDRGVVHTAFAGQEVPVSKKLWYKDAGLSLMFNSKWFFVGAQVDNIFGHDAGIYSNKSTGRVAAPAYFIATAGTEYESQNHKMAVSPYLLYQKYGEFEEGWIGANFRWKWINVGAALSSNIDPAASLGIKTDRFLLNYQADYTGSALTGQRALSHQLTLRILAKPSRYNRLSKL